VDALSRRKTGEIDASREITRFERRRAYDTAHILERLGRGVLDDEPRGTVGAAPHDGAIGVNVTGRDAKSA
jgi:hypothetical protein